MILCVKALPVSSGRLFWIEKAENFMYHKYNISTSFMLHSFVSLAKYSCAWNVQLLCHGLFCTGLQGFVHRISIMIIIINHLLCYLSWIYQDIVLNVWIKFLICLIYFCRTERWSFWRHGTYCSEWQHFADQGKVVKYIILVLWIVQL